MFKKILIANRGEIACRIIKTAHRMGIACVAVYSQADRRAPYVAMADEALCIGPAPATQSYLAIDRIIAACRASGVDAVHPGYGFLSESVAFAEAVEAAGLTFIGPNHRAIATMGDKLASKRIARGAGIPTLPGGFSAIADAADACAIAEEIGYPVILKPSAGGGGLGMRIAHTREDIGAGFARAQSEAASAFGDARIFIEKYIEHPRHIEIQILGDKFGNIVHLGERECSIQRRNQKLIEESPSPYVDAALRTRMGEAALILARAVRYDSAGTVEFIVEPMSGAFYFLEMNTRLQVEHPVTELVTGRDLLCDMIRIAAGEPLDLTQSDVRLEGWAIESRIYAEDPSRDFLPSPGRLSVFRPPNETHHNGVTVRLDTGVVEGSEIPPHYDPMLGKLISHASDRATAITGQADAIDQFVIEGICHNVPLLASIMQNPRFRDGGLSTDFLAAEYPNGFSPRAASDDELERFAAVAATIDRVVKARQRLIAGRMAESQWPMVACECCVLLSCGPLGRRQIDVVIEDGGDGILVRAAESGRAYLCQSDWVPGTKLWTGKICGESVHVQVRAHLNHVHLQWRGIEVETCVLTRREAELAAFMRERKLEDDANGLRSPMPGLVKAIPVRAGEAVRRGDVLCIIEAMKMEMVLRAQEDATVKEIFAAEGMLVGVDAPLMEFV
jgi:propionyl-CoA carboxylase alpha chain